MFFQPPVVNSKLRHHRGHTRPEGTGVVVVSEVGQLMHHHIIHDGEWCEDQSVTKIQTPPHTTRPPPTTRPIHPHTLRRESVVFRIILYTRGKDLFCLFAIVPFKFRWNWCGSFLQSLSHHGQLDLDPRAFLSQDGVNRALRGTQRRTHSELSIMANMQPDSATTTTYYDWINGSHGGYFFGVFWRWHPQPQLNHLHSFPV